MSSRWSLLAFCIIVPCAPVATGMYCNYMFFEQAREGTEWVVHTARVEEQVQAVKYNMRSGWQRPDLERSFDELERLVADNAEQSKRISVVRHAVLSDLGSEMNLELKLALFDPVLEAESALLQVRERAAGKAMERAKTASLVVPAVCLLLVFAAGAFVIQRIRRATYSIVHAAEDISQGRLDRRANAAALPEGTLRTLGEQFNMMAASMELRQNAFAMLAELTGMMQACDTVEEAAVLIEQYGPRMLPGLEGEIFTMAASRNHLRSIAGWGATARHVGPLLPSECWGLRRGAQHACAADGVKCAHIDEGPTLCRPLSAQGETLGLLVLRGDTRAQPHRVKLIAEQLALTIANLRLRRTLEEQSLRDPLTGLYNRRYLEESFPRELARADRDGAPLSVLMIDADHFKRFNDTQGHEAGDAALRAIGAAMRDMFRESDIVCRYGGEEFCVMLPACPTEHAIARAEELCRRVSSTSVMLRGERLPPITLSIGLTTRLNGEEATLLLKRADAALYTAKRNGRNRVETEMGSDPNLVSQIRTA